MKTAGSLLVRFILCFAMIACVWIAGIRYRIGPFDYQGGMIVLKDLDAFSDADRLLLLATLGLLIGLLGLYRAGRVSAVLMVLASLVVITAIDHIWSAYGYGDEYKGVPEYVLRPAITPVLIGSLAFLFPAGREASNKALAVCWALLILTVILAGSQSIGARLLHLEGMIGPTYMQNVFLCLLAAEAVGQARRVHRRLRIGEGLGRLG
jgi:hypothetical protein